eukprot:TRINITY_DN3955_c0_g1_i1.p1 TRINITY_DN3955_c0_g1~~TRINITY_DN3955_c0_g1_i1.p1  ORF type:complete len:319 (+),score=45.57 TRINITY_DN3955_c0_g1_i1:64-1020(+)
MLRRVFCRSYCTTSGANTRRRIDIREHADGTIAEVVLCRGDKLNVMDNTFFEELKDAFDSLSENEKVRCAVLHAEGKHFCAGLDLKAAAKMFFENLSMFQNAKIAGATALGIDSSITEDGLPAMRNQKLHKMIKKWQSSISSLQNCRVPVISAVHGKCIGGGVDLVTSADIRLCTTDALFSIKETQVAIVADLGTLQRATTILGQGVVRELAFTGDDLGAARAERLGFVNNVFDSKEELLSEAFALANKIASNSPLAVQGTKEILNTQITRDIESGLHNVSLHNAAFLKSDDLLSAVRSFMTKSKAKYTDHVAPARSV